MISKIYAFGETHHGQHVEDLKKFFKNFDGKLQGIFLEWPNDYQSFVNNYIKTGKISERMERAFKGALKEGNNIENEMLVIWNFCKINSIPCICIDSSKTLNAEYQTKSLIGNWYLKNESRDADMFAVVENILKEKKGEYLLICGANHLKEGLHFRSNTPTLGHRLQNLLGKNFKLIPLSLIN